MLDVEPPHFDVTYLLGVIFLQRQRYEDAEWLSRVAIDLRPDVAASHYNRGLALVKLNRAEKALASLNDCIGPRSDHSKAIVPRENVLKAFDTLQGSPR